MRVPTPGAGEKQDRAVPNPMVRFAAKLLMKLHSRTTDPVFVHRTVPRASLGSVPHRRAALLSALSFTDSRAAENPAEPGGQVWACFSGTRGQPLTPPTPHAIPIGSLSPSSLPVPGTHLSPVRDGMPGSPLSHLGRLSLGGISLSIGAG